MICNCDGTVSGLGLDIPDFLYHLTGEPSPSQQAAIACQNANARLAAFGVTCQDGDGDPGNILDTLFQEELGTVSNIVQTTTVSNSLQGAVDKTLGTAAPNVVVAPGSPSKPANTNYALLIGFIALLAIGFIFVFR